MSRKIIETKNAPSAIGPYSQGVVIESKDGSKTIYCSGSLPISTETGELITSSITEATHCCMKNLAAVLAEAGAELADITQTTIFMTDLGQFLEVNEAYATYFKDAPPARQTVGVAALPKAAMIEISAIAVKS